MRIAFIYDIRENVFGHGEDGLVDELTTELFSASEANGIIAALKELGHNVTVIDGAPGFLGQLPGIRDRIDFVFNEAKGLYGPDRKMAVPALCRIYGIPFLGSDGYTVTLCRNKFHTLGVAALSGVPVPESYLALDADDSLQGWSRYPAIVKPNYESASIGITTESVVHDPVQLRHRVRDVLETYGQSALVQEFVEGTEVQVSVVGNMPPVALCPTTLTAVFDETNPYGIVRNKDWVADRVLMGPYEDPVIRPIVSEMAVRCFRALGCSDYGRFDFRVDQEGRVLFVETATHPHIVHYSAFAAAAAQSGLGFTQMISVLLEVSFRRQRLVAGS